MYYCYIIYSPQLDKYYIGSTNDVNGRLRRHNSSSRGFTSTGKPRVLKYFEEFENRTSTIKRRFLRITKIIIKEIVIFNRSEIN